MDLHIPNSELGSPTSPMVAKQLEETNKRLNSGMKNIEIGTISADKFEMIPKQHFDEIRRLAKVTDAKISVHAPLVDLAGFPQQQGERAWTEDQRKTAESQVFSIIERSHKLTNGENVPIVFHAGHTQSQEYAVPYDKEKAPDGLQREEYIKENGKIVFDESGEPKTELKPTDVRTMFIVNRDSGEIHRVDHEVKERLGGKKEIWDVNRRLNSLNSTQWDDEKLKILNYQKEIEELRDKLQLKQQQNDAIFKTGLAENEEGEKFKAMLTNNVMDITRMERHINELNRRMASDYESVYNKFVKYSDKEEKEQYKERLEDVKKKYLEFNKEIHKKDLELLNITKKLENASDAEKEQLLQQRKELQDYKFKLSLVQSKQVVTDIADLPAPDIWKPVGEFAIEQTAKTVAGALTRAYKNLKKEGKEKEMPFLALENFFVNAPMSRARELKQVVEEGRKLIAENLQNDPEIKLSKKKAEEEAEKLLAATWDVGHINNLRKAGYEGEELKNLVIKETKEIAPVTRHVHITDNFGFFDSHLPPGMGNVPIKDIMRELGEVWKKQEKEGKLPQKPRSIVEAGGFVAEIGQDPTIHTFEFFGSPLYKVGPTPYFSEKPGYSIGFTYSPHVETFVEFPQQHFNLYGSSFTTLPKTFGGEVGGSSSRFSGTPNN